MALLNRKPTKAIKIATAADLLGCSRESVKNIAQRENWKMFRYGDGPTNPWLVLEADVEAFRLKRESLA